MNRFVYGTVKEYANAAFWRYWLDTFIDSLKDCWLMSSVAWRFLISLLIILAFPITITIGAWSRKHSYRQWAKEQRAKEQHD